MTTVADVLIRVRDVLQDAAGVRWVDAVLFRWVDDAYRLLGDMIPEAVSKSAAVTLAVGAEQSLPADGVSLIKIEKDPTGRRPRAAEKAVLDLLQPDWADGDTANVIRNYMRDETNKRMFWVYPPSVGAVNATINYQYIPTAVANSGDALATSDEYIEYLVDYLLYRAYDKDAEVEANAVLSKSHFERCLSRVNMTPRSPIVMAHIEGKLNG